jgi:hypothetical protein
MLYARLVRYNRLDEFLQRWFGYGLMWLVDLVASTSITAIVICIEFS